MLRVDSRARESGAGDEVSGIVSNGVAGLESRGRVAYVIFGLALVAVSLLGIAVSRLLYPFDLGHYEACVWTPARLIADGVNPYDSATRVPYLIAPYGPLYYLVIGWGLKAFGYQMWFGRALSLAAAGVCVFCVGRITSALTRDRVAVVFACIAVLSLFPLQLWLAMHRPDLPGLALGFGGLALVFTTPRQTRVLTPRAFAVPVLFVAAFLCKPTLFLFVGVGAARHLQTGRRRHAALVLAGTLALAAVGLLALDLWSGGWYFRQYRLMAQASFYSLRNALRVLGVVLREPTTLILLAVIAAGVTDATKELFRRRRAAAANSLSALMRRVVRSPTALTWAYLIAASGVAFATSTLVGAGFNYWLEAGLVASIAAGVSWSRIGANPRAVRLLPLVFLTLALGSALTLARVARGEYFRWRSLPYYREIAATLERETSPGEICFSVYPELATYAGREYHFSDWMFYFESRSPALDRIWRDAILSRRYAAIVWSTPAKFPGYRLVPMRNPVPDKFHPVFLFVRTGRPE